MAGGQGPSPMALGGHQFRALGFAFHGQGRKLATPWAEVDVTGRFDALHWTGPKSDTFDIQGCIFEEAFGGLSSLEGIRSAAIAGQPLMLVTRAGRVGGMHVVMGVDEDRSAILASGMPRKVTYSIQLRRYSGIFGGGGGLIGGFF